MALVSPLPAIIQQEIDLARFHEVRVSANTNTMMVNNTRNNCSADSVTSVIEEKLYIALSKDLKESKYLLSWGLQHSGGKKICVLHVHQPAQMIPLMGTKFPASKLKEQEVKAYRDLERKDMHKILNEYILFCSQVGARAEKLHIESDCVEKGIVELISRHGIRKLIMGAATYKHYSRKMMDLKSKKAIYVREHAYLSCHIWFVCKGQLICTRNGGLSGVDTEATTTLPQASPNPKAEESNSLRSRSMTMRQNNKLNPANQSQQFRRAMSAHINEQSRVTDTSSSDGTDGVSTPRSRLNSEFSLDESDGISRSHSQCSDLLTCTSKDDFHHSSPPSVLEGTVDEELYDQLEQARAEAKNSRRKAFEESVRCGKAEKDALEAISRAKAVESLYSEELKKREEVEVSLLKEKQELENLKKQRDNVMEEFRVAMDQKSLLERQIAESEKMENELKQKFLSAVELLQNYKKEREDLQVERDKALKLAEELRQKEAEASSTSLDQFFSEFSFSEIEEATRYFHPSLKIGEGGYGSIYKGFLRHTEVAIKMLHSHSLQGPSEYQQEVEVLSKLRHPNLVTLIGACPEAWALVYEYLSNGSLEDRLSCKDNSPPLSWQTRIRIAAELCSVLVFLHSSKPNSIVHGDLKPANILLDANFVSKLSDFGICRILFQDECSSNNSTVCCRTDPKGTFAYMDPEFLSTGELTTKSDVYSFGIILLRLLTGKPALGITKEVKYALDKSNLKSVLDYSAGDWPYVQAQQLAHLALRCAEMCRRDRPDLGLDVWRVLEPMRASCGGASSSLHLGFDQEHCQAPPYFICPIFQEVMQDPHVAADGYTYEAEALRGWLDSGHDTSPMTNLQLAHTDLVPNLALRSAIQEWLQEH